MMSNSSGSELKGFSLALKMYSPILGNFDEVKVSKYLWAMFHCRVWAEINRRRGQMEI